MVWLDQGLYFSLGLNACGSVVLVVVAFLLHRTRLFARVLRPNLPGSRVGSFFQLPAFLLAHNEDDVAEANGVEAALYLLVLKWASRIFLVGVIPAIIFMALNATDSYLNDYAAVNDPKKCSEKNSGDCGDSPFCHLLLNGTVCAPMAREGLFDLGMENVTPKNWRMYVIGAVSMLFSFAVAACFYLLTQEMVRTIRRSYVKPWNKHVKYGTLGSVGARTVLLKGLSVDDKCLLSNDAFLSEFLLKEEGEEGAGVKVDPFEEAGTDSCGDDVCGMPLHALCRDVLPESVNIVKAEPDDMLKLIAKEAEGIARLTEDIAEDRDTENDEERPLVKRPRPAVLCCRAKVPAIDYEKAELEEVRSELRAKVAEVPAQDPLGYVFFTFHRPSKAWAFAERFRSILAAAQVVGPRDEIHWHNLAVNKWVLRARWVLMVLIFIALVFFWTIPVAFFGSLENLAGLPGIGGFFSTVVDRLGPQWTGIIQANLPAIVIAVFNVLLPIILRVFAHLSGVLNFVEEEGSVLWMYWLFTFLSAVVFQAVLQGGIAQITAVISNSDKDAWFALVVAIMSPQGGYWGALVLISGLLLMTLQLLLPGPVIMFLIFRGRTKFQEAYDALFDPRVLVLSIWGAKHLLIFAVCMLFHTTLPLLVVFGCIYFLNSYLVFRGLILDGCAPTRTLQADLSLFKSFFHIMALIHNFGTAGTVIVCVVKEGWGAVAFTAIGCAASIFAHAYCGVLLHRAVSPTAAMVAELDKEVVAVEGLDELHAPYMPDYCGFSVDEGLVARLEAAEYTLDTAATEAWVDLPPTAEIGGNDPIAPRRSKPNGDCFASAVNSPMFAKDAAPAFSKAEKEY